MYKEVERKLNEARGNAARGIVFDAQSQTVGQWLGRWLEDVVKPGKGHRTYATHCQQVLTHIAPAIGRVKLEALRKIHIDRLYVDLLRAKPEGAGLAPSRCVLRGLGTR
jgi:integrase